MEQIWNDFSAILGDLKHDGKFDEVDKFKSNIRSWLKTILTIY